MASLSSKVTKGLLKILFLGFFSIFTQSSFAGYFELSANGSYFFYNNGESVDSLGVDLDHQAETRSRRIGGSFGYHFLANASFEISYVNSLSDDSYAVRPDQDIIIISRQSDVKNTSFDLVLDFNGRQDRFRPFAKTGVGYMIRKTTIAATDKVSGAVISAYGSSTEVASMSANLGIGFKYFVAQSVGIDISYSLYATDLDQDEIFLHYSVAGGLRFLF